MKRIRLFSLALIALCLLAMFCVERGRANAPHVITITGASTTVQLLSTDTAARAVNIFAPSTNMSTARAGDSTTSSTVGQPLAAGSAFFFPPIGTSQYSLNQMYVYVATGDVAIVVWTD